MSHAKPSTACAGGKRHYKNHKIRALCILGELGIYLPAWMDALPLDHPVKTFFTAIRESCNAMNRICDVEPAVAAIGHSENVSCRRNQ